MSKGEQSILGDLPVESVGVNLKGGSLTATIKKQIRAGFEPGMRYSGANIDFGGANCVLITPHGQQPIRVRRLSQNAYVIEMESNRHEEVDPVTVAILKIMDQRLLDGDVALEGGDDFFIEMQHRRNAVGALARAVRAKRPAVKMQKGKMASSLLDVVRSKRLAKRRAVRQGLKRPK